MCKKILFYPTKSGHNLPYRGEVRHERKLTWGRRVPASALPTWGSMPQAGNTWSMDIYVFASQGIEPWLANADAGTRRPQVRTRPPPG